MGLRPRLFFVERTVMKPTEFPTFHVSDLPNAEAIQQAFIGECIGDEELWEDVVNNPRLREDVGFVFGQLVRTDINLACVLLRHKFDSDEFMRRKTIAEASLRSAKRLIEQLEQLIASIR